ncbi:MAG TPA: hypothetical protein VIU38_01500 [Anaerolineales bacterium]
MGEEGQQSDQDGSRRQSLQTVMDQDEGQPDNRTGYTPPPAITGTNNPAGGQGSIPPPQGTGNFA